MLRLLQGDVGSGKTIISIISGLNVVASGFQVALMCPTENIGYPAFKFDEINNSRTQYQD